MEQNSLCRNTLKGMGILQIEVLHLISIGKSEKIKTIEKCFEDENLIEYIFNKYSNEIACNLNNDFYDIKALDKYFKNYDGYISGNESRKYGIENENDGLLLILALISDKIGEECHKWTVD